MPIHASVILGRNVRIHQPCLVNLYGCTIGDETRVGPFVEVQTGAVIGARCKLQSHCFICEGVTLARLRGFGRFDAACVFPINSLAGKVFTTGGAWGRCWW